MYRAFIGILLILLAYVPDSVALAESADTLIRNKFETLSAIDAWASEYCGNTPKGLVVKKTGAGAKIFAGFTGLLKKIGDLGFELSVDYEKEIREGILPADVAEALADERRCKEKVLALFTSELDPQVPVYRWEDTFSTTKFRVIYGVDCDNWEYSTSMTCNESSLGVTIVKVIQSRGGNKVLHQGPNDLGAGTGFRVVVDRDRITWFGGRTGCSNRFDGPIHVENTYVCRGR